MKLRYLLLPLIAVSLIAVDVSAATKYSDLRTNEVANPIVLNNPNVDGGVIRRKRATYTFDGTEAAADVIEMVTMPKGSIVHRELSTIVWEDTGTTTTVDVGDGDDDDRYCSALNMGVASTNASSERITFMEAVGTTTYYLHNVVGTATTNDSINLTLDAMTTPTSGARVTVDVVYSVGY